MKKKTKVVVFFKIPYKCFDTFFTLFWKKKSKKVIKIAGKRLNLVILWYFFYFFILVKKKVKKVSFSQLTCWISNQTQNKG